jgi:membrane associated rhomboid family serine protease
MSTASRLGWLHPAMNTISLYLIDPILERMWGSIRYVMLYLLTGICGSAVMVLLFTDPANSGAGASGAIQLFRAPVASEQGL